jgi:hypothetical protein
MARITEAMINGRYPLALAPEGQVSYASERLPRLEQGTVRLGLAAADELDRVAGPSLSRSSRFRSITATVRRPLPVPGAPGFAYPGVCRP